MHTHGEMGSSQLTQASELLSSQLSDGLDLRRLAVSSGLDAVRRSELGQFLTPVYVARQMVAMVEPLSGAVRLLDPGAGIGTLGATLVQQLLHQESPPTDISLVCYEIDEELRRELAKTLDNVAEMCAQANVTFTSQVCDEDFVEAEVAHLTAGLFRQPSKPFDAIIMNPPYRKIATDSPHRRACRRIGLETSNLYTAFLAIAAELLRDDGQLVAIVPRSFANGTYFEPFRRWFTARMTFRKVHVYESRHQAFSDDSVLQENVIFHAAKSQRLAEVAVTSSAGPGDESPSYRSVPYSELIAPDDGARVVHIVSDETGRRVAERMASLPATLAELGLTVSTGRVVDFRARQYLRNSAAEDTVPLIYPGHLRGARIAWPMAPGKKPNALQAVHGSANLLVREGLYVLTKRFSSKEELRRVVAALYDPADTAPGDVAFENHLNYFHRDGGGLDRALAIGLCAFLNSTLADLYFRQFSGHTQVNAGDLRRLRYPSVDQLRRLGERSLGGAEDQRSLDRAIDEELFLANEIEPDPVRVQERVKDAVAILHALGLPRAQLNDRSGLTLLALLGLGPIDPWSSASAPLCGITPMMDVFRDRYGKVYAPNTRETVRRQTVHQFLDAGLIVINPDLPTRPTNSPKAVYQVDPGALSLVQTFGTPAWSTELAAYLARNTTLSVKYAAERKMSRIPVTLPDGSAFSLSGGGQNVLMKKIVEDFCPRWTPGGRVLYLGDADEKFAWFDKECFQSLGINIEGHGKMPDVVVLDHQHGWLVLIEAVTSHGPVDGKRRRELSALFRASTAPLVFVTAFLDRRAMVKYLPDIAWETEVWCAADSTHLIHFNGERYLGPYDT